MPSEYSLVPLQKQNGVIFSLSICCCCVSFAYVADRPILFAWPEGLSEEHGQPLDAKPPLTVVGGLTHSRSWGTNPTRIMSSQPLFISQL